MFDETLPFVRKDKETFIIEAVVVQLEDRLAYACRVWKDDIIVNDPKAEYFKLAEDAIDVGIRWAKEWKG